MPNRKLTQLAASAYSAETVSPGVTPYTCCAIAGVLNTHIENRANQEKNCTTPNCFIALGIFAKSVRITARPFEGGGTTTRSTGEVSASKCSTSSGVYSRV